MQNKNPSVGEYGCFLELHIGDLLVNLLFANELDQQSVSCLSADWQLIGLLGAVLQFYH